MLGDLIFSVARVGLGVDPNTTLLLSRRLSPVDDRKGLFMMEEVSEGVEDPKAWLVLLFKVLVGEPGEWGEFDWEVCGEFLEGDENDPFRIEVRKEPRLDSLLSRGLPFPSSTTPSL